MPARPDAGPYEANLSLFRPRRVLATTRPLRNRSSKAARTSLLLEEKPETVAINSPREMVGWGSACAFMMCGVSVE